MWPLKSSSWRLSQTFSLLSFSLLLLYPLSSSVFAQTAQRSHRSDVDRDRLALIRPRLQALVDSQQAPGAVYLVAHHGRIVAFDALGWADVENHKPMQKDTIVQIMSMTKNFTGVAAMMLVEEGKLDLRRPVADYLPDFKNILVEEKLADGKVVTHAPNSAPTVWELMDHTSGLATNPSGDAADVPYSLRLPLDEAVHAYSQSHLLFEPGAKWTYSNMGIATLGRIIEVVSGQDYVHFVTTRILDPLGMKDTFYFPPQGKKTRIAFVYKHENGKLVRSGKEALAGDSTLYRAGAKYPGPELGLYSTASDLLRFYQMLLSGGTVDGHRYLSRRAVETMTRIFTPDIKPSGWFGGTGYGLTFEVVRDPVGTLLLQSPGTFGHGGAFGTEGWMDPKSDLVMIALVQLSDGTGYTVRQVVFPISESAVLDAQ